MMRLYEAWLKEHDASQIESLEAGFPEQTGDLVFGSTEGRPPDGVVKINLSPEDSRLLKNKFNTLVAKGEKYNGISNNCTSFVCEGLTKVGINIEEESVVDWRNFLINEWVTYTFTPNETYKQLSNMNGTEIIKDASDKTKESYEEAVIDQ